MPVRQHYTHEIVEGRKVGRLDKGINTQFIVYRMNETVIDAGPSNQWRHVRSFLDQVPVKQLLLTHHHEDHSGNAQRIADRFDLVPKAPRLSQQKLANGYPTPMIQKIVWGNPRPVKTETLGETEYLADGSSILSVATPGHAKDLTCYLLPEQGYFFSGDLYIAKTIKLLRSDEDLPQMITSLKKAISLDFEVLFCPHGGVFKDGKKALQGKLKNILELCSKVQELDQRGWDENQITLKLLGQEDMIGKLSRGNFSRLNLVTQCKLVEL